MPFVGVARADFCRVNTLLVVLVFPIVLVTASTWRSSRVARPAGEAQPAGAASTGCQRGPPSFVFGQSQGRVADKTRCGGWGVSGVVLMVLLV